MNLLDELIDDLLEIIMLYVVDLSELLSAVQRTKNILDKPYFIFNKMKYDMPLVTLDDEIKKLSIDKTFTNYKAILNAYKHYISLISSAKGEIRFTSENFRIINIKKHLDIPEIYKEKLEDYLNSNMKLIIIVKYLNKSHKLINLSMYNNPNNPNNRYRSNIGYITHPEIKISNSKLINLLMNLHICVYKSD